MQVQSEDSNPNTYPLTRPSNQLIYTDVSLSHAHLRNIYLQVAATR